MASEGSVTSWLDQLKAGDTAAAQPLWEAYFRRLVALARGKLQGAPRRAADEEDVALSAFDSFCRGAEQGRDRGFAAAEPLPEEMRTANPDGEDGEGNQAEDQQLTGFAARHHKVPPVRSDLQ